MLAIVQVLNSATCDHHLSLSAPSSLSSSPSLLLWTRVQQAFPLVHLFHLSYGHTLVINNSTSSQTQFQAPPTLSTISYLTLEFPLQQFSSHVETSSTSFILFSYPLFPP